MAKNPGTGVKVGTHFSPRFKRPLDDRFQFDTVAEMKAFPEAALYDSLQTYVTENKKYYKYLSTNTIDPTTGKWREVETVDDKQDIIQYTTLPVASSSNVGEVYQYVGETTENYKVGNFYQSIENPEGSGHYEWKELQAEVESIQKEILPTPSSSLENKIYQYIGENVIGGYQKGYFYICTENSTNPGTYIWKQKNVQPSVEGGSVIERDITANVNVGGVTSGRKFDEGTSVTDVLEAILRKAVYQKVTLTLKDSNGVVLPLINRKHDPALSYIKMEAKIVKGDYNINNAKYYVGSTLVDTKDSTTDPAIPSGGTFTYDYENTISNVNNTTFKVSVSDINAYNVDGTSTIKYINPYYWGISDTYDVSSLSGLSEHLDEKSTEKTVGYTDSDNKYLVFVYDKSYGVLTSIKDPNNFENIDVWHHSEYTDENNETYYVYITNDPITIGETETFNYTFKI